MAWNITLVVGVLLVILATFLGVREHRWIKAGATADGVVVELVPNQSHSRSGGGRRTTYYPRVTFTDVDGREHMFTSSFGSRPAGYEVGEIVKVSYDRTTYEGRILNFKERFGAPVLLAAIGLGAIFTAVTFMIGKQLFTHLYLG